MPVATAGQRPAGQRPAGAGRSRRPRSRRAPPAIGWARAVDGGAQLQQLADQNAHPTLPTLAAFCGRQAALCSCSGCGTQCGGGAGGSCGSCGSCCAAHRQQRDDPEEPEGRVVPAVVLLGGRARPAAHHVLPPHPCPRQWPDPPSVDKPSKPPREPITTTMTTTTTTTTKTF